MKEYNLCKTEADLKKFDKTVVKLIGIYQPRKSEIKMGGLSQYLGYVSIVVGSVWIRLGVKTRPVDEIKLFSGKKVVIIGEIVLNPPMELPAYVAQPIPPPTIYNFDAVSLYEE